MGSVMCRQWFPRASIHQGPAAAAAATARIIIRCPPYIEEIPTTIHRRCHRYGREYRAASTPRQYHSSTHDNDIEALRQILRKSTSRERQGYDSSLRRRSSATTFGMSEKLDELLRQPKDDEQVLVQQSNGNGDHPQQYTGYREDYFLGDVVKSVCHMVIEPTPKSALQAVESLQLHNFAWVKRSDGLYTYAILAYRSSCPLVESASSSEKKEVEEEYMYFVVDDIGSTKMVPKSRWHVNVRRIHEDSE